MHTAVTENIVSVRVPGIRQSTKYNWAKLTLLAVVSLPAGQAVLLALRRTRVVSELVVARPAEGGASRVVVVGLARDAHAVRDGGGGARMPQRVPLRSRLHDARPPRLLDQTRLLCDA